MALNSLYMFEFVVDDLFIARPNCCAPEEYPTCVEITFRSSVFVQICDREFGACVDLCAPKCCKCCLFSLESPVTDKDRILVHAYKKKDEKCKFLLGAGELPIKNLFDKVTELYNMENPGWMENLTKHSSNLPNPRQPKPIITDCNRCEECDVRGRPEQFCSTNDLIKSLIPLFNMNRVQTGNLMLITRLVCSGPAIVSSYPFSQMCKASCPPGSLGKDLGKCGATGNGCGAASAELQSGNCSQKPKRMAAGGYCVQPDPCCKPPPVKPPCKRYFACNVDKGCPCDECEDEYDRECPSGCAKKKLSASCPKCPPPCCKPSMPKCCKKPKPKKPKCQLCEFTKGENDCCCEDCQAQVEAAKERALQKLRYLLQKYSDRD